MHNNLMLTKCDVRNSVLPKNKINDSNTDKVPATQNAVCRSGMLHSKQERTKLRESVPYVKLYRYNPKHLYPKLNGYGDNAQRKCGHLAFPRTVRLQLCSALAVREECGTHFCDGTSSAQRNKIAFHYCRYVQCLVTLRTTVT